MWLWIVIGLLSPVVLFVVWALLRDDDLVWSSHDFGDPSVRAVLRVPSKYDKLKELLEPTESGPWDARYLRSLGVSRSFPLAELDAWIQAEPSSSSAHLALGARHLSLAWKARGDGFGRDLSPRQVEGFRGHVEHACRALLQAASLNAQDPTPWAYMIMVTTYQNESDAVRERCFREAIARDPENWPAHLRRVVSLTKKWSGSHEAMYAFARDVAQRAPEGSDLPIVLHKAHLEYDRYLRNFDQAYAEADRFMADPAMREECFWAYAKSLAHPAHEERTTTVFARINASAWLFRLRDRERLKIELDKLGSRLAWQHWKWLEGNGDVDAARKFAAG